MSTIYLVTSGEYSDYHVVGACSTEEHADQLINAMNGDGYIEPFEIDAEINLMNSGLHPFTVWMDRDGNVTQHKEEGISSYSLRKSKAKIARSYGPGVYYYVSCWARDLEHAVKISNELRIQELAKETSA